MNINKFVYLILLPVFLFPSSNKFNYEESLGEKKISFTHQMMVVDTLSHYAKLVQDGIGNITEVGAPELPMFSTYFQLDPFKNYEFSFEILDSYIISDIEIFPFQGISNIDNNQPIYRNEEIYASSQAFPEKNMIISERSQGRGIEFLNIQVVPYKYYPRNKKLEVYTDIEILIEEVGFNEDNTMIQSRRSKIFDKLYKDLIVNFQHSNRPDDYQASSILYIAGGDWLNNAYVQNLLRWRHKQGYIVNAISTSDIGASNGNENIVKDYIQEAYENWENPPEIVGLIGDTDVIDCFYQSWGTGGWNSYNGSTDSDFGYLSGNDLIPEVIVGRISAQGSSTMDNVINKTLQYEKALYVDDQWFMRAALVGDPSQSGNSTIFTSQYIDNIMTNHGMTGVETYYFENGITNWLVDQFNEGISYYNYRGIYGDDGTDFSQLSNQINNNQ